VPTPRWWRLDDPRPWMTLRLYGLGDPDTPSLDDPDPPSLDDPDLRPWMRSAGGDGGGGVVAVGARIQKN